jgi:gelsolin
MLTVWIEAREKEAEIAAGEEAVEIAAHNRAVLEEAARVAQHNEQSGLVEKIKAATPSAAPAAPSAAPAAPAGSVLACTGCGNNVFGKKFCAKCGTKVPQAAPVEAPKEILCAGCGNNVTGKKFCRKCGSKVDETGKVLSAGPNVAAIAQQAGGAAANKPSQHMIPQGPSNLGNRAGTNIENLGSQMERDARRAAALTEAAFANAGKEVGLKIWRIEKMKVIDWPVEKYGVFHDGDSYIVLNTWMKNKTYGALKWDIHFWLGQDTPQDAMTVAAYKTVELDDILFGAAVQHREVQEHESDMFLSYFNHGIEYAEGGVATGLKTYVEAAFRTRLYQLKGKINIRVKTVDAKFESLNTDDVFILDTGKIIYQWHGENCSPNKRSKASEVTAALRNERAGKAEIAVLDQNERSQKMADFFAAIGGVRGELRGKGADDLSEERAAVDDIKLFRLLNIETPDAVRFDLVARGLLSKDLLTSDSVYLLDNDVDIFVWIGKTSGPDVKRHAMKLAQDYMLKNNLPLYMSVSVISEEASDCAMFSQSFQKRSGAVRQLRESYYQEKSVPKDVKDKARAEQAEANQRLSQRLSSAFSTGLNLRASKIAVAVKLKVGNVSVVGMENLQVAMASIFRPNCFAGWVVLGYVGPSTLAIQAKGKGAGYNDAASLAKFFKDDQIQYALLRLPGLPAGRGDKFNESTRDVFIYWLGNQVKPLEKGRKKTHIIDVHKILRPFQAELEVTNSKPEVFNEGTIRAKIAPNSGSHVIS